MRPLKDYAGRTIRLTDERLRHILEHPEMGELDNAIGQTLRHPERVVQSVSDENTRLYYRFVSGTLVGDKWLCVVVKYSPMDAFVLTAYLTDRPKEGTQLWPAK